MSSKGKERRYMMAADSPKPRRCGMERSPHGGSALSKRTVLGMSAIKSLQVSSNQCNRWEKTILEDFLGNL